MLKIKHGSIFDDKCDLLILPCDSIGGVTSWVRSEIEQNRLPFPNIKVPFGKVVFMLTNAEYPKADFIGYAASVNADINAKIIESSLGSIAKIISEIVDYCKENNCTIVNLPLLGTGAGKLDPSDVVNLYQNLVAEEGIIFTAYVPDASTAKIFIDRVTAGKTDQDIPDDHPRVFISYS